VNITRKSNKILRCTHTQAYTHTQAVTGVRAFAGGTHARKKARIKSVFKMRSEIVACDILRNRRLGS